MSPPHFPITPDQLEGSWTFDGLDRGVHEVEGFSVTAADVPHKGGRTFGYRVESEGHSFVYLPDHATCLEGGSRSQPSESVLALLDGADVLAHDAQFTDPEHEIASRYGHATISDAVELAEKAGVARLVLFHHAPARTDEEVAELTARAAARTSVEVIAATEGLTLDV
jgi:ribonuclease BN (tRNA processing enzyme)